LQGEPLGSHFQDSIFSYIDPVNPLGGQALEFPGTYSYQSGTNKLTHIESTPPIDFGYDANANITSETGWTYVYDLSNQLYRVYQGTNLVAEYVHNGAGQRIKKVVGGTTKIFHYDLWGHLIAETDQSGQMISEYVYLGDQLLAMIRPGENVYYFHNDHLGLLRFLRMEQGALPGKQHTPHLVKRRFLLKRYRIHSGFRANTTTPKQDSITITSDITIRQPEGM
jgi:YD repeat-containing protein